MAKKKSIFRKLKEAFINFFGNIRVFKGGIVLFGGPAYGLKGPDWRDILNLIQPGDIIGNSHKHYVSSFFIKGDFGHVGLYVGNNKIIHVVTAGIVKEDILTFLRADGAFIVRPKDQSVVEDAIKKAYTQLAKKVEYDYDFDKQDIDEFYCSEFTDYCTGYPLRSSMDEDKKFILPDDYLIPSEKFEIIYKKI